MKLSQLIRTKLVQNWSRDRLKAKPNLKLKPIFQMKLTRVCLKSIWAQIRLKSAGQANFALNSLKSAKEGPIVLSRSCSCFHDRAKLSRIRAGGEMASDGDPYQLAGDWYQLDTGGQPERSWMSRSER